MYKLNFYRMNEDYMAYISKFDSKVSVTYGTKAKRPFIGIVLKVDDSSFFAPLTSPKPKHINMKNMSDFLKIDDGVLGAINFNNMIPVLLKECILIDIEKEQDETYKNLLYNQLKWCNKSINTKLILNKANNLYYDIVNNKARQVLIDRCCDFRLLENKCKEYYRNK